MISSWHCAEVCPHGATRGPLASDRFGGGGGHDIRRPGRGDALVIPPLALLALGQSAPYACDRCLQCSSGRDSATRAANAGGRRGRCAERAACAGVVRWRQTGAHMHAESVYHWRRTRWQSSAACTWSSTIGASGLSIAALGSSCAVFPLCCRYSPEAHWWSVRRRAGRPFRCVSLQLHWRLKRQARLHQVTGSCVASHGSCHAGACAMVLTVVFG